jgi:hypothetical protein
MIHGANLGSDLAILIDDRAQANTAKAPRGEAGHPMRTKPTIDK